MKKALWLVLSIVVGALAGLAMTFAAVDRPPNFGVVSTGPWITRPGIGSSNADPYSKALMSARGEIPMGASEGLMLTATEDSAGNGLDLTCTYILRGTVPAANFWTLAIYRHDGAPVSDQLRSSYTSSEALMNEVGGVVITLSPKPHPGNWLPLSGRGSFELYLRLYETQVSSSANALDRGSTPTLTRESCE